MQLITIERSQTTKLLWGLIVLIGLVLLATLKQSDPTVTAAGFFVVLVSLSPFYLWVLGWSHGLPIWPVFCLVNGVGYGTAMLQNPDSLVDYTPTEIIVGGITMAGFVLLGTFFWIALTARSPRPPAKLLMIDHDRAITSLQLFLGIGVLFQANQFTRFIPLPESLVMVVRGIALSLAFMALFVLAYYDSRGGITVATRWYLGCCAVLLVLAGLASLMLAQAAAPLAMVILGYTLGGNRVPWKLIAVSFVVAAILHPGKYQMRARYWGGEGERLTIATMPGFFSEWAGYGLSEIGGISGVFRQQGESDDSPTSVFERAGSLHMLLRVQRMSPDQVPYLLGLSYTHIPRMLIPRFIDSEKGISHAGNQMLSVNYGLVDLERVNTVSIQWGLVPEAYANFGFVGVAGLAVCLSVAFSLFTRLTVRAPLTSLRFVMGLLVMLGSTTADTMGVFIPMQFQGIMAVSMASMVFMRRQRNPFAAGGGEGTRQTAGGKRRSNGVSVRQCFGEAKGQLKAADQGFKGTGDGAAESRGRRDKGTKGQRDQETKGPKDQGTTGERREGSACAFAAANDSRRGSATARQAGVSSLPARGVASAGLERAESGGRGSDIGERRSEIGGRRGRVPHWAPRWQKRLAAANAAASRQRES